MQAVRTAEEAAPRLEMLLILGSLSAFAPLAIDMYLPALPALQTSFQTTPARVQWTLAAFFLGFALGQAFYGPITDRFGRKPPLYASLALFTLASAGCALAPTVEAMVAFRFLQALGACAGGVISRAVVRDLYAPRDAAAIFSTLMLVVGVAPMLGPLFGGYVLKGLGWRAIFWSLALIGLACLLAVRLRLPETHRPENVRALSLGPVLQGYGALFRDRGFIGLSLAGGLAMSGMFAYITGSPFVFIELHGVPPERYGLFFGANALGLVVGAQVNARLSRRWGSEAVLGVVLPLMALAGLLLLGTAATGWGGLAGIAVPLFLFVSGVGFVAPNTTALAMARYASRAGTASALLGTLQFGLAAVAAMGLGLLQNGSALPMSALIAGAGILAALVQHLQPRRREGLEARA